jgi:hypothetical protein
MSDPSAGPLETRRRNAFEGPLGDVIARHVGERHSLLCGSSRLALIEIREPLTQQSYRVRALGGAGTLSILTSSVVVPNPVDGAALVDSSESSHRRVRLLCGSAPHMRHNDGLLDAESR